MGQGQYFLNYEDALNMEKVNAACQTAFGFGDAHESRMAGSLAARHALCLCFTHGPVLCVHGGPGRWHSCHLRSAAKETEAQGITCPPPAGTLELAEQVCVPPGLGSPLSPLSLCFFICKRT